MIVQNQEKKEPAVAEEIDHATIVIKKVTCLEIVLNLEMKTIEAEVEAEDVDEEILNPLALEETMSQ